MTTSTKIYLVFQVLVWLPYGLYCVFQPGYLGEIAGLVGTTPTGTTEIRAMYGGLQAGIGALCALALSRTSLVPNVLIFVAFMTGGLAIARSMGLALDGSGSAYTYVALGFEIFNTSIALFLVNRHGGTK